MKRNYLRSFAMLMLAALITVPVFYGCKSSKKSTTVPKGETKVEMYCTGSQYFSDNQYFRESNVGESTNQSMAKRKAMSNARLGLASAIETTVKAVIDNYFNSYTSNQTIEDKERYEGLSREVINQKLNGIRTICEEYTKTAEGNYKCYVAIELAGDEIASGMAKRISEDDKLKIDFQYENFKKTFEKEMEEFKNQRY